MKKLSFVTLLLVSLLIAGCGGGIGAKSVFETGTMPASGNFDGVYQSDFGRMELTVQGNQVVGLYEGDQTFGRIEGEIEGDLMHFQWTQWNADMQGRLRETTGRGVFKYFVEEYQVGGKTKEDHKIDGVWGYGKNEAGNNWDAYKLKKSKKRLEPHETGPSAMEEEAREMESVGFDAPAADSTPAPSQSDDDDDDGGNLDDIF